MNGTPRLRSAYPQTPRASPRQDGTPRSAGSGRSASKINGPLPELNTLRQASSTAGQPLISFDTIDAPQQRLYVVAIYVALFSWKIYDFHNLQEEQTESFWNFLKWLAIDAVTLFGLPELRIPWLEWSSATMAFVFLFHALLDGVLMFRIPIPLGAGIVAFLKLFYDRELAISERHVKQSSVLHNASLILGKQIIHILPEGSASLNPGQESYCLGPNSQVLLPIQLNQTHPIEMQILHIDLDTNKNETIRMTSSQIKKLMREAQSRNPEGPLMLHYPVKKTGLYLLQKVVDESKLEVRRRRRSDTLVVPCPRAIVKPLNQHKCKGELSNVVLEVTGTAPLKVKYRKLVNDVEHEAYLQSIQPEDFVSPLTQQESNALILRSRDISWARTQTIEVPLSELLGSSGRWAYLMDQVQDSLGNVVNYSQRDHDKQEKTASPDLHQVITVHDRPTISIEGCNTRQPLKVAKGHDAQLPFRIGSTGRAGVLEGAHTIEYSLTEDYEPDEQRPSQRMQVELKNSHQRPLIRTPGLYTLESISSEYCPGEVLEPASCLLQNPQEPSVRLETEQIFDKCAHKAIGLRVDLHLTGSPPFEVRYVMEHSSGQKTPPQSVTIQGLRGQVELTPRTEGHYTYRFTEINDATYKGFSLANQNLVLEQDVKPSAHAQFVAAERSQEICIDQTVTFMVSLRGEGPFTLEYELVRGNQRKPFKITDIKEPIYEITTDKLTKGGDYTLALVSITDSMGCKEFLKEEAKISVRHQKPKAAFGHIENARLVNALENRRVGLPLRLSGESPWTVTFRNLQDPEKVFQTQLGSPNDKIEVQERGSFELLSVKDRICTGAVEKGADTFNVEWIARPALSISPSSYKQHKDNLFVKHDVCEGEKDMVEVHFRGELTPSRNSLLTIQAIHRFPSSTSSNSMGVSLAASHSTLDSTPRPSAWTHRKQVSWRTNLASLAMCTTTMIKRDSLPCRSSNEYTLARPFHLPIPERHTRTVRQRRREKKSSRYSSLVSRHSLLRSRSSIMDRLDQKSSRSVISWLGVMISLYRIQDFTLGPLLSP